MKIIVASKTKHVHKYRQKYQCVSSWMIKLRRTNSESVLNKNVKHNKYDQNHT